jgi:hypothetical protein
MNSIRPCVGFMVVGILLLPMALSCADQKPAGDQAANASFNQGVEALDKNEFDRAIADFTEAIRLDPKLPQAYHNRGVACSTRNTQEPTAAGVRPMTARARRTRPLLTTPKPSASTRLWHKPTAAGAHPMTPKLNTRRPLLTTRRRLGLNQHNPSSIKPVPFPTEQ